MRKVAIWGVVLVCLTVVIAGTGATAQRTRAIEAATTRTPSQVEVVNFPPVQVVSGTVSVGNLPAVQTVGGSVTVSNLPVDADGALRIVGVIATTPPRLHFVGFTTETRPGYPGTIPLSRLCNAEFPDSRICSAEEMLASIPPAPEGWEAAWIAKSLIYSSWSCINAFGEVGACGGSILAAACCGY